MVINIKYRKQRDGTGFKLLAYYTAILSLVSGTTYGSLSTEVRVDPEGIRHGSENPPKTQSVG